MFLQLIAHSLRGIFRLHATDMALGWGQKTDVRHSGGTFLRQDMLKADGVLQWEEYSFECAPAAF